MYAARSGELQIPLALRIQDISSGVFPLWQ